MKAKKMGRKFFDWFGKNKLYFLRGYNQYFQLPIGLINSSAIMYYLIIDSISTVPEWLRYWMFIAVFLNVIILFGWFVGRFDYRRGTFKKEQLTFVEQSPIWKKVYANQERIEKKLDKLLEEIK